MATTATVAVEIYRKCKECSHKLLKGDNKASLVFLLVWIFVFQGLIIVIFNLLKATWNITDEKRLNVFSNYCMYLCHTHTHHPQSCFENGFGDILAEGTEQTTT